MISHRNERFPTTAQVVVAREYLRTEQAPVEASADDATVIGETGRRWPGGWASFCGHFAAQIGVAEDEELALWFVEAEIAARGHLLPSRLPAAALSWGVCHRTATAAVTFLATDIVDARRAGTCWSEIAALLDAPVPVAMLWAIEGRARSAVAWAARFVGSN